MRVAVLCLLAGCDLAVGLHEIDPVRCGDDKLPIDIVQFTAVPMSDNATAVDVPLPQPQAACDLNVVIVGWGITIGGSATVTDDAGNTYARASLATYEGIYYAPAIAAGSNVVHVTFNGEVYAPDVRVLEYQGIAPLAPVDDAAAMSGTTDAMSTPPVQTKHAYDLLVAGTSVAGETISIDPLYTQRIKTSPNGNVAVDRIVESTGPYDITGMQDVMQFWTMNLVAFKGVLDAPP